MSRWIPIVALSLAFATTAAAEGDVDWGALDIIDVVTTQADGTDRSTTIWIVSVDGSDYIRTSEGSAWGDELDAAGSARIVGAGETRSVTATRVPAGADYDAIEAAFRAKYGFQDAMISWVRGEARIWRLADAP